MCVCVCVGLINYLHHWESSVDTVYARTCSSLCLKDDLCVTVTLDFSNYWSAVFWDAERWLQSAAGSFGRRLSTRTAASYNWTRQTPVQRAITALCLLLHLNELWMLEGREGWQCLLCREKCLLVCEDWFILMSIKASNNS